MNKDVDFFSELYRLISWTFSEYPDIFDIFVRLQGRFTVTIVHASASCNERASSGASRSEYFPRNRTDRSHSYVLDTVLLGSASETNPLPERSRGRIFAMNTRRKIAISHRTNRALQGLWRKATFRQNVLGLSVVLIGAGY